MRIELNNKEMLEVLLNFSQSCYLEKSWSKDEEAQKKAIKEAMLNCFELLMHTEKRSHETGELTPIASLSKLKWELETK
tara:strand:- start:160 stop:396 length:237 start_codon:yes stop_codon:yes gene_type:complete